MDPIITAVELHRALQEKGIELSRDGDRRDDQLLKQLAHDLGFQVTGFTAALANSGMSAEQYLRVFIRLAGPFAQMYKEIWSFMCQWYAPKAGENLRIKFGLDGDTTELNWDEFRESVRRLTTEFHHYRLTIWPFQELFAFLNGSRIHLTDRGRLSYKPCERLSLPRLAGTSPIESLLNELIATIQVWIDEVSHKGVSDERLVDPTHGASDPIVKEVHRVQSWRDLAYLLTDVVPGITHLTANWGMVTADNKDKMFQYYLSTVEPQIVHIEREGAIIVEELLDVLNMPFWKHRWHTYEIWCSVVALQALSRYKPQPAILDESLGLDASTTRLIAQMDTEPKLYVQIQPQYALAESIPVQRGTETRMRKEVRPDLRIGTNDPASVDGTIAIIEFKQREALTATHVREVLDAYGAALGARNGCVTIANYDAVPAIQLTPEREYLIGYMRPGMPERIAEYKKAIQRVADSHLVQPYSKYRVVLLDASQSMEVAYALPLAKAGLKLVQELKDAHHLVVYCFGSSLREAGNIMDMQHKADDSRTDLAGAIVELIRIHTHDALTSALIVSDGGYDSQVDLSCFGEVRVCAPDELVSVLSADVPTH